MIKNKSNKDNYFIMYLIIILRNKIGDNIKDFIKYIKRIYSRWVKCECYLMRF